MAQDIKIEFLKYRGFALVISIGLLVFSFYEWAISGDNKFGVDFVGGTELVVAFEKGLPVSDIRERLKGAGYGGAIVQSFENSLSDYSIRVKSDSNNKSGKAIVEALNGIDGNSFKVIKEDFVGPTIGAEIRSNGLWALIFAIMGILVYIYFRFELRFAIGAIVALMHDVIIATGIYILSGREISAAVLAALLTIIGYSLNDTIIVFDRIRENILGYLSKEKQREQKRLGKTEKFDLLRIVNLSLNQTLSRTLLTSLTTLFVVLTLWIFGGGAVSDLAFTLVVGVIVGTYSSIFVASPVLLLWKRKPELAKEEEK